MIIHQIISLHILTLCWFNSPEEAGRYLETYKSYEKKPADILKEQVEKNYLSKVAFQIKNKNTNLLLNTFKVVAKAELVLTGVTSLRSRTA